MNRHSYESRSAKKSSQSIDKFLIKVAPRSSIQELNRNITIGLCIDLPPCSRVQSRGFMHLAQCLIDFGAKFGALKVSDVIQHRTTLQRNRLMEICDNLHAELKVSLLNIPTYPHFAFTSDLGTEKHHSQGCLALTAHFIDTNWIMTKKLLGMEAYDEQNNDSKYQSRLFENSTALVLEKSTGESGTKAVFPNREPCQCHNINLFVEWTFSDKKIIEPQIKQRKQKSNPYHPKRLFNLSRDCPRIAATIKSVRDLVTYFKQTHLNTKLTKTLKQEISTRFNSLLFVLSSYKDSAEEVKTILIGTGRLEMVLQISDSLVEKLIDFLEPFDETSKILSAEKYPTINLIALYFHILKLHIQVQTTDSPEMKILKEQAGHCFREYCKITTFHYMATLLDLGNFLN